MIVFLKIIKQLKVFLAFIDRSTTVSVYQESDIIPKILYKELFKDPKTMTYYYNGCCN